MHLVWIVAFCGGTGAINIVHNGRHIVSEPSVPTAILTGIVKGVGPEP